MKTVLYVVPEHDGRWDDKVKLNNSWNTTQEIIRITPEYIADEEQKRKERKLKSRIDNIRRTRENILENRKYPKKLLTEKFKRQMNLPKQEIINLMEITTRKDYKEFGYFTAYALDMLIKKEINLDGYVINPSDVWMNSKTNKWLRKIDLEMERRVNKNFKYSDFKRCVTCNYEENSTRHQFRWDHKDSNCRMIEICTRCGEIKKGLTVHSWINSDGKGKKICKDCGCNG